jgi:hypothetical protein
MIIVAIWLAPALVVGFLLFLNARRHDDPSPRQSDAPPAE